MMWTLIVLICSIPAVWSKEKVTGIVGRSITIDCNYNTRLKDNMKYWCQGRTMHCSYLVRTTDPGGQQGRMSIKDNKTQGVFVVTMEGLRMEDAGWYSCGIGRWLRDELTAVKLEVFYDPVSLPVIRFLSPSNISCFEHSVCISCESAQGSLPIRYTWYEKTTSEDSMISENNKVDLHCQLFKLQHHQYYCTASNTQGEKYSEMVNVSVIHRSESNCSYLAQIGSHGSTVVPAKNKVTGVLGRAITIDCHYDKWSQLYVKFWSRQCSVLVKSNDHHGQRGRISIIDNKTQNMFSVTMEDLHSEDAGWYSCGIEQSGHISVSTEIELQVSHGADYCCGISTVPVTTSSSKDESQLGISPVYIVVAVLGTMLIVFAVLLLLYLKQVNKGKDGEGNRTDNAFENQQMVGAEENIVYATIMHSETRSRGIHSEGTAHFKNNANGVMYAEPQFQKKSSARSGETSYSVTRGNAKVQSQLPENKVVTPKGENLPESEMPIYAEDEFLQKKSGFQKLLEFLPWEKLIFVNKTMWTVILLICSIPVSDALWAKRSMTGILGREITIHCRYEAQRYQSHIKYWCHGWSRQCNVIAATNWANGRISITDNKAHGIFLVTMKNLQWGDAGWYSCGIEAPGLDPMFYVQLHISEEDVSAPELRFLSQPNSSCFGGSVTISCESARGSLPIHYTWSEKTPSQDSKISDTNKLDLCCQSFTQQHQYYCTASNTQGTKSSEIVHVSVNNLAEKSSRYIILIDSIKQRYICNISPTISLTTTHSQNTNTSSSLSQKQTSEDKHSESLIYIVLGVLGAILVVFAVSLILYLRQMDKGIFCIMHQQRDKTFNDDLELASVEKNMVYANINHIQTNTANRQRERRDNLKNDEIMYSALEFQKKSSSVRGGLARHTVDNSNSVIYSDLNLPNQPLKGNKKAPRLIPAQGSETVVYADIGI
ncbi:uncharacterized protein LOC125462655 [Stegostoma tigrinum]|uniref:uncharacterized protein LOC125462655 n=1 Tax=Stegostoma tigrinum TaxID=3053191 RepID=UPI0028707F46|nr:uncharacterized protein LOC125462655 [Stegostoma tigrinum]